ncbi:DUF6350 family protein [Streptomyces sp. NPDC004647]|uniref:cell division protein PerM n=1 Tax=Streptomyces sp. NPDC004647 TaxID=3154671 RepID=UPI0033B4AF75
MTQLTDHSATLSSPGRTRARRVPAATPVVLGGAVAAGLGLGAVTVVVLLLWISSPYPDSGPGGALHIAADLWLLAHGAELVRTETLSGHPAPVGLTPLLLSALPLWLLYRAGRHMVEAREEDWGDGAWHADEPPSAFPTIGWLSAGYLLVGVAAVGYASGGPIDVDPLSALLHVPIVVVGAASYGVWTASGRPREPLPALAERALDRVPGGVWVVLTRPRLVTALRGAAAATAVLLGGGALLVAVSLAWHGAAVQQSLVQLAQPWSGRFAAGLLAFALAPNAAVWGAAYGLGPGFTLGAGSVVGSWGASTYPELPYFPLLAAVPGPGSGGPLTWTAVLVPVAAGLTVGYVTARAAVVWRGAAASLQGWRETALTAGLASLGCAVAMALLAGLAGGPLGAEALEDFGPDRWLTAAAALGWTALVGVPGALGLRWWWTRGTEEGQGGAGSTTVVLTAQRTTTETVRAVTAPPRPPGGAGAPPGLPSYGRLPDARRAAPDEDRSR